MSGGTKVGSKPRVAVFASGGGSTFRAVAEAIADGLVDFTIALVITDHPDAGVLTHVEEVNKLHGLGIKSEIVNRQAYPEGAQGRGQTRAEADTTIRLLQENNIDHLALMGCLRIIAKQVIDAYGWKPEYADKDAATKGIYYARMTNTHPGILPATTDTYGIHTQATVLEQGLNETAQTFHVVAAGVDKGPVVAEHRVRAFPGSKYPKDIADTPEKLFARVQKIEKANIAFDLDAFLKDQALFLREKAA